MGLVVVTGSAGLIGSEAARLFADKGLDVVGVDNDMRKTFFGVEASTVANRRRLETEVGRYRHVAADIRDSAAMECLFADHEGDIVAVIHAAAQPSHDWAADRFWWTLGPRLGRKMNQKSMQEGINKL